MKNLLVSIIFLILLCSSIGVYGFSKYYTMSEKSIDTLSQKYYLSKKNFEVIDNNYEPMIISSDQDYFIQWQKDYGPDDEGGRYEGPQPIGDCDNDGKNEILIGGRDGKLSIFQWNEVREVYEEEESLSCPFQNTPLFLRLLTNGESLEHPPNPSGFAIGDITGDKTNEIAVTWFAEYENEGFFSFISIYKWLFGSYKLIGFTTWVLRNSFLAADCFIGDCDNDGDNDLILSGEGESDLQPEIVVFTCNGLRLVKLAEHNEMNEGYAPMAGLGDVDNDGFNEIVYGAQAPPLSANHLNKVIVLDWNETTFDFDSTVIYEVNGYKNAPFGGWCVDSDGDGIDEIHVGYTSPRFSVFEWNSSGYVLKFDVEWPDGESVIEGINVGDVDFDGIPEVCVGSGKVHILQWNGLTYEEESILTNTYGMLAVVIVGDCDNDGKNEINVAPVLFDEDDEGKHYIYWIFKHRS